MNSDYNTVNHCSSNMICLPHYHEGSTIQQVFQTITLSPAHKSTADGKISSIFPHYYSSIEVEAEGVIPASLQVDGASAVKHMAQTVIKIHFLLYNSCNNVRAPQIWKILFLFFFSLVEGKQQKAL